jgi:hypothetical protein
MRQMKLKLMLKLRSKTINLSQRLKNLLSLNNQLFMKKLLLSHQMMRKRLKRILALILMKKKMSTIKLFHKLRLLKNNKFQKLKRTLTNGMMNQRRSRLKKINLRLFHKLSKLKKRKLKQLHKRSRLR